MELLIEIKSVIRSGDKKYSGLAIVWDVITNITDKGAGINNVWMEIQIDIPKSYWISKVIKIGGVYLLIIPTDITIDRKDKYLLHIPLKHCYISCPLLPYYLDKGVEGLLTPYPL
jgi:hypothetical protein